MNFHLDVRLIVVTHMKSDEDIHVPGLNRIGQNMLNVKDHQAA